MRWTRAGRNQRFIGPAHILGVVLAAVAGCSVQNSADTAPSHVAVALPAQQGSTPASDAGAAGWTYLDPNGPLRGYGWSRCTGTVTVSADTSYLNEAASERVRSALKKVASLWSAASGLTFTAGGSEPLRFDPATTTLVPVSGPPRQDHIYLALEPEVNAPRLDGNVVGLGTPTLVLAESKQIVGGEAVFEAEYVNAQSKDELIHLFTHELGHILGLGHSPDEGNIMHAVVTDQTKLGPGDVAGINAVMRPCPSPTSPSSAS